MLCLPLVPFARKTNRLEIPSWKAIVIVKGSSLLVPLHLIVLFCKLLFLIINHSQEKNDINILEMSGEVTERGKR